MEAIFVLRLSDGREYSISRETRVGAAPPCEILLRDPLIAPHHATLWVQNGFCFVRDENSPSGTFVNSGRLPAGQPFQLRPGDTVRVGGQSFATFQAGQPLAELSSTQRDLSVPPPAGVAAALVLRLPDGREISVARSIRLGRDLSCNFRLDDDRVSGHHATVWPQDGLLLVRDEGSTNGTYVNETRLAPGQPTPLRVGDRLGVGRTLLTVAPSTGRDALPQAAPAPSTQMMPRDTVRMTSPPAPAAPQAAPALRGHDGREYHITGEAGVGREADCQIVLGDSRASRRHARLWVQFGSLMVRDENSSNGTFVNDVRLAPGQAAALRPGDRVRFADTPFTVAGAGQALAAPPRPAPAPQTEGRPASLPPMPAYASPGPAHNQPAPAYSPPGPTQAAPASRGRSPLVYVLAGGGALLLFVLIAGAVAVGAQFLPGNRVATPSVQPQTVTTQSAGGATPATAVAGVATPNATPQFLFPPAPTSTIPDLVSPAPLTGEQFAEAGTQLTDAIATLNEAQWAFTQNVATADAAQLDADLLEIAAQAMIVARLGDKLAETVALQGGSPEAIAAYDNVAETAYLTILEAHNVRDGLAASRLEPEIAAERIGALGARLLTPRIYELTGETNPFAQYLDDPASAAGGEPLTQAAYDQFIASAGETLQTDVEVNQWLSSAEEEVQVVVPLPEPSAPVTVDLESPAVVQELITPQGQRNYDVARLYASSALAKKGAESTSLNLGDLAELGEVAAEGVANTATGGMVTDVKAAQQAWNAGDIPTAIENGNRILNNDNFTSVAPPVIANQTGLPADNPIGRGVVTLLTPVIRGAGAAVEVTVNVAATIHMGYIGMSPISPTTDDSLSFTASIRNALGQPQTGTNYVWAIDGRVVPANQPAAAVGPLAAGAHTVSVTAFVGAAQVRAYLPFNVTEKPVVDGDFIISGMAGGDGAIEGEPMTFVVTVSNNPPGQAVNYEWFVDGQRLGSTSNTVTFNAPTAGRHWLAVTAISETGLRSRTWIQNFETNCGGGGGGLNRPAFFSPARQETCADMEATEAAQAALDATATEAEARNQLASQTAAAAATATESARQTEAAQPEAEATITQTPQPTATFAPVVIETWGHPGNVFATGSTTVLQPGRLYRICLSGTVYLINPDSSKPAGDLMHVNGIDVPGSGCVVLEGNGAAVSITCGHGEPAEEPGGYEVSLIDLGPQ